MSREQRHLRGWASLEPYLDKDLSPLFEAATTNQLKVLIEAMNAGDGAKMRCPSIDWEPQTMNIGSARKTVVDRLQSLCVRRGIRCNIALLDGIWHAYISFNRSAWGVNRSARDNRPLFAQLNSVPGERVWCISVDTGAILTRRNGKVAVLGNCQMVGRGTRPLPGLVDAHPGRDESPLRRSAIALSPKTHVLVIDFTENSGKHKLISATDLLAGKYSEPELAMAKAMLARHEVKDILEALRRARAKIKEMEEMRAQARKGYAATTIDPFDPLDILDGSKQGGGGPAVSEKQRRVLKEYGVENVESLDAVQAAGLLKTVAERKAAGLADFNQVRVLMRRGGIRADRVVGLTSLDAAGYIAKLAKNNWRRPPSWDIKFGPPEATK